MSSLTQVGTTDEVFEIDLKTIDTRTIAFWMQNQIITLVNQILQASQEIPIVFIDENFAKKLIKENIPQTRRSPKESLVHFESPPIEYQTLLNAVINGSRELEFREWQRSTMTSIRAKIGLTDKTLIPSALWQWIGHLAWSDPLFQIRISEAVAASFRERTLFRREEIAPFHIDPHTYWLLLCIGASQTASILNVNRKQHFLRLLFNFFFNLIRRLKKNELPTPADQEMLQASILIRDVSLQEGLHANWAQWADQWLLIEALRVWTAHKLPNELNLELQALPLIERLRQKHLVQTGVSPTQANNLKKLAFEQWEDHMPRWFDEWFCSSSTSTEATL